MVNDFYIKNGYVFTDEGFQQAAVLVRDGKIDSLLVKEEEPLKEGSLNSIDASGCIVVPGFIDSHVHFNDPGRADWEGFETGSRAAAIGGTTTVFDMPLNSCPSVTSLQALRQKSEHVSSRSYVDYALWGGLTGSTTSYHTDFLEMSKDIVAWKAFMCSSGIDDFDFVSPDHLKTAMKKATEQHKILALHAEWEEEVASLGIYYKQSKGLDERLAYLRSRPVSAEVKAVAYALDLAAKYGTSLHFVHISSPKAVGTIHEAKRSGVDVTVETCPHYLIFDEDDFLENGAVFKCAPPLRSRKDVEGLWECIVNGWIDTIGSDHSPSLYSMKTTDSIWDAWGGIQAVQFTWPALLDQALKRGISLTKIIPLGTSNVAGRFSISDFKGRISPGMDADLVLIRLDESTSVDKASIAFKNPFSPYEGQTFHVRVKKTILRGTVIYDDQTGVIQERTGRCINQGRECYEPISSTLGRSH
ncbi:allantoinase AllB [Peribacillus sp. SCS-155]|uniref:allantoinase AllB n=1 Tax=Peribacillus sedimenti TaxID=3115297 RepID=UPI00390652A2